MVGSGRCEQSLRALADKLGITAQIEFIGHQDDVTPYLQDVDVGVLPSLIEGLSNTMLEFMASCIPVIASRVSGSEDFIVDERNGWLFAPGDRAELARKLPARGRARPAEALRDGTAGARGRGEALAGAQRCRGRPAAEPVSELCAGIGARAERRTHGIGVR